MKPVVFVDRDGTIIREPRDKQIDSLEKLSFVPGIVSGLKLLTESGFRLILVSNQDGLGTRRYPQKHFLQVQTKIDELLAGEGIRFEKKYFCPHTKGAHCSCRKPQTGLVKRFIKDNHFDRARSFVLGDRETDVEFAKNLGVRAVRLSDARRSRAEFTTPDALAACRYIFSSLRRSSVVRDTRETHVSAGVALDGSGKATITTGIGFFDHMLNQLARHSGMDLTVSVRGDLHIDEHHSVEDTGIVLGRAIREALGEKRGIERFGFSAPLDESLASVAIDLSGRSYLGFACDFRRERLGELPTELIEDFFKALADGLAATVHISCRGRNDHHKAEAIFKAFARALRQAIRRDFSALSAVRSTKGVL